MTQIDNIIKIVAKEFELSESDILGKSRSQTITEARHMSIFIIREYLKKSFNEIGSIFSKDHSSIQYAINKVKSRLGFPEIQKHLSKVLNELDFSTVDNSALSNWELKEFMLRFEKLTEAQRASLYYFFYKNYCTACGAKRSERCSHVWHFEGA